MTYTYQFGGLAVESDFAVPGLCLEDGAGSARRVRVIAREGAPVEAEREHYAWPGRYRLKLGEADGRWLLRSRFDGSFLVARDGSAVEIVCASLPPAPEVMEVLVRRVLPRIPILFGAAALHAGTVAKDGASLVLAGRSGAGKSTLAAAMAGLGGWEIWSDDIATLWAAGEAVPVSARGATGVCLWPEARAALALPEARCMPMMGYEGKVRFEPEAPAPGPAVLRGLIFPERAEVDAPRLEALTGDAAMAGLIANIVAFNPHGSSAAEHVRSVSQYGAVVRAVPAWRLVYPDRYDGLAETVALLGAVARAPD